MDSNIELTYKIVMFAGCLILAILMYFADFKEDEFRRK